MATIKTYAQLRTELDELLNWFDGDDIDIDQAVEKYEQALKLTKQLELYLQKAENKITKLKAE
jgi:exodeoxyribonuclease VII small subunit